jgi:hypothetical protein
MAPSGYTPIVNHFEAIGRQARITMTNESRCASLRVQGVMTEHYVRARCIEDRMNIGMRRNYRNRPVS